MNSPSARRVTTPYPYLTARLIEPADTTGTRAYRRLRYRYFVEARSWIRVALPDAEEEGDRYDRYAWHLGVFEGEDLAAYLRVVPAEAPTGIMLDHDFRCLLPEAVWRTLQRDHAVELSRLVVALPHPSTPAENTALDPCRNRQIMEMLLKRLYDLALERGFQRFYIEVETHWIRTFARRFGLPFTPLADPYIFPDGTKTVAAYATLEELERAVKEGSPEKYRWYRTCNTPMSPASSQNNSTSA